MAKKQKQTRVLVLLDETGSMTSVKQATMSGFDEYVQSLAAKTPKATLTLVKFNSKRTETVFRDRLVTDVPPLTDYAPDEMTNLYDAIGAAIADQEQTMKTGEEVLFVIITDGEENSSREWDMARLRERIEAKEKDGWAFVYIGAVLDAWAVGASIGVAAGNISSYNAAMPKQAFGRMGLATSNYVAGNSRKNLLSDD